MGEMWNALSDAERLPYERAAREATRLQYYERAAKFPVSDPTLGALTAAPTTLSTRSNTEFYDALLLAQRFDHASNSRFVSEFLDRALEKMTEEEAVEVILAGGPAVERSPRSQPRLCLDDHQQDGAQQSCARQHAAGSPETLLAQQQGENHS